MPNKPRKIELDVREMLHKKLEPFQVIMEKVRMLQKQDTFVLHATFKPTPLLGVMKMKGYRYEVVQASEDHWIVTFRHKSCVDGLLDDDDDDDDDDEVEQAGKPAAEPATHQTLLDNRGLEPPKPMIRTLHALDRCKAGDKVRIHNDRVPLFLIEELKGFGYPFQVEEQPDGSAIMTITKK